MSRVPSSANVSSNLAEPDCSAFFKSHFHAHRFSVNTISDSYAYCHSDCNAITESNTKTNISTDKRAIFCAIGSAVVNPDVDANCVPISLSITGPIRKYNHSADPQPNKSPVCVSVDSCTDQIAHCGTNWGTFFHSIVFPVVLPILRAIVNTNRYPDTFSVHIANARPNRVPAYEITFIHTHTLTIAADS